MPLDQKEKEHLKMLGKVYAHKASLGVAGQQINTNSNNAELQKHKNSINREYDNLGIALRRHLDALKITETEWTKMQSSVTAALGVDAGQAFWQGVEEVEGVWNSKNSLFQESVKSFNDKDTEKAVTELTGLVSASEQYRKDLQAAATATATPVTPTVPAAATVNPVTPAATPTATATAVDSPKPAVSDASNKSKDASALTAAVGTDAFDALLDAVTPIAATATPTATAATATPTPTPTPTPTAASTATTATVTPAAPTTVKASPLPINRDSAMKEAIKIANKNKSTPTKANAADASLAILNSTGLTEQERAKEAQKVLTSEVDELRDTLYKLQETNKTKTLSDSTPVPSITPEGTAIAENMNYLKALAKSLVPLTATATISSAASATASAVDSSKPTAAATTTSTPAAPSTATAVPATSTVPPATPSTATATASTATPSGTTSAAPATATTLTISIQDRDQYLRMLGAIYMHIENLTVAEKRIGENASNTELQKHQPGITQEKEALQKEFNNHLQTLGIATPTKWDNDENMRTLVEKKFGSAAADTFYGGYQEVERSLGATLGSNALFQIRQSNSVIDSNNIKKATKELKDLVSDSQGATLPDGTHRDGYREYLTKNLPLAQTVSSSLQAAATKPAVTPIAPTTPASSTATVTPIIAAPATATPVVLSDTAKKAVSDTTTYLLGAMKDYVNKTTNEYGKVKYATGIARTEESIRLLEAARTSGDLQKQAELSQTIMSNRIPLLEHDLGPFKKAQASGKTLNAADYKENQFLDDQLKDLKKYQANLAAAMPVQPAVVSATPTATAGSTVIPAAPSTATATATSSTSTSKPVTPVTPITLPPSTPTAKSTAAPSTAAITPQKPPLPPKPIPTAAKAKLNLNTVSNVILSVGNIMVEQIRFNQADAETNALFAELTAPTRTTQEKQATATKFIQKEITKMEQIVNPNSTDPNDKLKVGYLKTLYEHRTALQTPSLTSAASNVVAAMNQSSAHPHALGPQQPAMGFGGTSGSAGVKPASLVAIPTVGTTLSDTTISFPDSTPPSFTVKLIQDSIAYYNNLNKNDPKAQIGNDWTVKPLDATNKQFRVSNNSGPVMDISTTGKTKTIHMKVITKESASIALISATPPITLNSTNLDNIKTIVKAQEEINKKLPQGTRPIEINFSDKAKEAMRQDPELNKLLLPEQPKPTSASPTGGPV